MIIMIICSCCNFIAFIHEKYYLKFVLIKIICTWQLFSSYFQWFLQRYANFPFIHILNRLLYISSTKQFLENEKSFIKHNIFIFTHFYLETLHNLCPGNSFQVHQLQDVAHISRMCSQLVHPFSPAASKSSPLQVSSRYHGSAIQSATSG